jgi:soluble lytic murein transglycosylase-like protein
MSRADAAAEYGVPKSMLQLWLEEYGRFRPKKSVVEVVMKSEKEKITELEKALADAHLKLRLYDEMIKLAGKKYKVDLKKTFGMEQLESSKGRERK